MDAENGGASDRGLTVGSLLGQPQGQRSVEVPSLTSVSRASGPIAQSSAGALPTTEIEGEGWQVRDGRIITNVAAPGYTDAGVERLDYNNPYDQTMERVWFDGKLVYAVDVGEVDIDPALVKVAQEYQIVYGVELDERGKKRHDPEMVPGQLNIYDSVPGMAKYSPIWQFNYVIVPRSYQVNSLRSEADCLNSSYPVLRSNDFEN